MWPNIAHLLFLLFSLFFSHNVENLLCLGLNHLLAVFLGDGTANHSCFSGINSTWTHMDTMQCPCFVSGEGRCQGDTAGLLCNHGAVLSVCCPCSHKPVKTQSIWAELMLQPLEDALGAVFALSVPVSFMGCDVKQRKQRVTAQMLISPRKASLVQFP